MTHRQPVCYVGAYMGSLVGDRVIVKLAMPSCSGYVVVETGNFTVKLVDGESG